MKIVRLIDADALKAECDGFYKSGDISLYTSAFVQGRINCAPTIDAVPVEKYNELREAFVDYVCSGVQNPAPYCKNRFGMCVNGFGWCLPESGNCRGFNPDGERKDDD